MYRVLAIIGGALLVSACASTPSWMTINLDSLKPEPPTENIAFESEPPGAEVKTSSGQACRTPCSLAMPASGAFTATFTLAGFQPASEQVELIPVGDGTNRLRPNPVLVELTPAPPPAKKPPPPKRAAKPAAKKPAPKPTTGAAPPAAPAPAATASSPWPAPQQPR